MWFKNKISSYSLLTICFVSVVIFITSCTGTVKTSSDISRIKYKPFEMKIDDTRLNYLEHPLYSFEYPEAFNLLDIYQFTLDTTPSKHTDVLLTIHQTNLPEIMLWIRVQEPWSDHYINAKELKDYWVSYDNSFTDNIKVSKTKISGISANYFESFQTVENGTDKSIAYPYQVSHRILTFDNSGLIWEIKMFWFYQYKEPTEVQQYFNHFVETFKIRK